MNNQSPLEFTFTEKTVRVEMDEHNNPWFCATDVCAILGYTNTSKAIADHCKEAGITNRYISYESGAKQAIFINEGNLYRLIIKSRKPEAEKFESWVCDEVLPTIRKTGSYAMNPTAQAAAEYVTSDQLNQISQLVHEIMLCCHFSDVASHAAYAGIREQYGITNIGKLPSAHYEKVYACLLVIREKATEYLNKRTKADKAFIKEVIRHQQVSLPIQGDMFLPG